MPTITPNTAPAALKKIFDEQIAVLTTAELATEAELAPLFPLLEKIGKVTEGEGRIPFVIVLQKPGLTLARRMAKVVVNGKTGVSRLADCRVGDIDNIPDGHYLAVCIEDGRSMRSVDTNVALEQFKQENRFGGTIFEGISVVTYNPEILRHHRIDLLGSRSNNGCIPCLRKDGTYPELGAYWVHNAYLGFGSLSCGRRLGIRA